MFKYYPKPMRVAPPIKNHIKTGQPVIGTILLVNPFYTKDPVSSFGKHVLTPTLALTSIAGSTPVDWKVNYWDENLLQGHLPFNIIPQVVGITVHLTFAKRAYEIARFYRNRGSVVVLGGMHASSCTDELMPHGDIIVKGEGVKIWPEVLEDIKNGTYRKLYCAKYDGDYHIEPESNRTILPEDSFLTSMSIIATRGCSNRCDFCYLATRGLKMPYSARSPEQIAEEIKEKRSPYVVFTDNNLAMDHHYLRKLCKALQPLEIMWNSAVTLDVTDDPSLVRDMALSGCTGVFLGLESLNNQNIVDSKKRSPSTNDYARRIKMLHNYGVNVNGSFVFGFDHDTPEVFDNTIKWIEENRLACATFHILTPYPGTPLFRQMEMEGRLKHKNWDKYDTSHVVFRPKHMTPEQLKQGYDRVYQRLFSFRSIWKRRPVKASSVPAYLAATLLYKRSNIFWHFLIKYRLTRKIWRPLVELSRKRNLRFRKQLLSEEKPVNCCSKFAIQGV